jgi:hypothetical protein
MTTMINRGNTTWTKYPSRISRGGAKGCGSRGIPLVKPCHFEEDPRWWHLETPLDRGAGWVKPHYQVLN